ncbi:hypothetical protein QFZ49_007111 [Streptomyces turgidiscabies]|uniref:NADPH-dependent FMN reductase-like domain-containing protein n=1 Tax=Streptomyces turgidiscabies TaxID=85558 RepID=A0ABU0RYT0_9ACTN|nr:hypothetical protein [Streptomyces turgidiscabies]
MDACGVSTDESRAVDHDIAFGVYPDMTEHGFATDAWPALYEKVMAADILVLAGPIWLGDNSSVMKLIIERLYSCSSLLNSQGQYAYSGGHAQTRRRCPRPRQPALGVGRRLPAGSREPRAPLSQARQASGPEPQKPPLPYSVTEVVDVLVTL